MEHPTQEHIPEIPVLTDEDRADGWELIPNTYKGFTEHKYPMTFGWVYASDWFIGKKIPARL